MHLALELAQLVRDFVQHHQFQLGAISGTSLDLDVVFINETDLIARFAKVSAHLLANLKTT